ncbi:FUSC family protein [Atlantibacter sp.]|uniref:FUSC family protein n=1 Tax=Atlantibacter sp. TaxID=1903473 RepID=UPI0028AEA501|nr:FUSC family protein [Atlantibacter sp.]
MNNIYPLHLRAVQTLSAALRHFSGTLASSVVQNDANALLYAFKSFAAAMLAYYIALSIGLERPSWAIITVYIVSQTSVGASLSRSLYRLAGTLIGAGATVLIVPTFVNMPIFCSVMLTGWITFCLYLSLLERTPRAYAFVLAGYTASLIGFPAVFDPGAIFHTAVTRVLEIMIGIFCAGVIHRYVLPRRLSGLFNSTLSQTLRAARKLLADSLAGAPDEAADSLRLAQSLQFLQGINHHIPYDFALSVPVRHARKALHDRLARLLIVSGELRDRLPMLEAMPSEVKTLLDEVQQWLALTDDHARKLASEALVKRSEQVTAWLDSRALTFDEALLANFARHVTEAIVLLQHCDRFTDAIYHAKPASMPAQETRVKGYVFHRDNLTAARTALGAFAIILSGCLIWIYSAWPDGGTAVSILGVCCTLFGSFDTPAPHIVKYIVGSFWGVLLSLLYSFAVLPGVNDFAVLVAVLAPAYLLAGSLQARPPTTFMAMGITLTLPILCELGAHYSGDIAVAINTAIALFAATGFAVVGMSVLQTVQADTAIRRLLNLCQRDIRRSVQGAFRHDETHWTNLMIDRTALLLPRLQQSQHASEQTLQHMLHTVRIGLCAIRLRRCCRRVGRETAKEINAILSLLTPRAHTRALRPRIASLIEFHIGTGHASSRCLVDRLLDLYCALGEPKRGQADGE